MMSYLYLHIWVCWHTCVLYAGSVGADHAIFEQGASAGNVGNERLVAGRAANPTALLLSSAMMLRHLQFPSFADRLEQAVMSVVAEGTFRTKDLGGTSGTQDVVDAVIEKLTWKMPNLVGSTRSCSSCSWSTNLVVGSSGNHPTSWLGLLICS